MRVPINIIGFAILTISCQTRSRSQSNVKHELGIYTTDTSPYNWQELTLEDLKSAESTDNPFDTSKEYLSESHPAVQRLQFWVNQIDNYVREHNPRNIDLSVIPHPNIIIRTGAKQSNAHVTGVTVKTALQVRNSEYPNYPPQKSYVFSRADGHEGRALFKGKSLIDPLTLDKQLEMVRWYFNSATNCAYEIRGTEIWFTNGTCNGRLDPAENLETFRTANWIIVESLMLSTLSEFETISYIAHELAHYYRTHVTAPVKDYNFYYRLSSANTDTRPRPDLNLASEAKAFTESFQNALDSSASNSVPGRRLNSAVYNLAYSLAYTMLGACNTDSCTTSCKSLVDFFSFSENRTALTALSGFPRKPLDSSAYSYYDSFETVVTACATQIQLLDAPNSSLSMSSFMESLKNCSPILASQIKDLPKNQSLLNVFEYITAAAPKAVVQARADYDANYQKMVELGIGWYTKEQEADELGLEFLAAVGIAPETMIEAYFKTLAAFEAIPQYWSKERKLLKVPTAAECRKLYKNSWKDDSGKDVIIHVGGYSDEHHTTCFRIFNADREIKVHKYRVSNSAPITPPGGTWVEIVSSIY